MTVCRTCWREFQSGGSRYRHWRAEFCSDRCRSYYWRVSRRRNPWEWREIERLRGLVLDLGGDPTLPNDAEVFE